MADYRYLIVGGGMTGDAACKGIRSIDPDGSIGLVGAEPDPPYARPPLSHRQRLRLNCSYVDLLVDWRVG